MNPQNVIFRIWLSFILFFSLPFMMGFGGASFSQINMVNNGLPINNTGVDFVIDGNITHQNNDTIANTGNFYITGDWINDNPSSGVFTAGTNGWLHLYGAPQTIGGTTITHFNNLELSGTGIKQLNNIDTEIEDTLGLNDREFASANNTVFVISTATGVVTRTSGFVSSTNDGGLSRNTLAANTYFFPVGSSTGTPRFRPIDITPNSQTPNTFKVRMANVDASNEGFDRSLKENTIGEINPYFYHRINRTNGSSSADISLYYDQTADGDYHTITHWQNTSLWKNLGTSTTTNNYGLSGLTQQSISDFSTHPFALSEMISSIIVPNVFSPNGDGINDVFTLNTIGLKTVAAEIYNRWGQKLYEWHTINGGWDGYTVSGVPVSDGTYYYTINATSINGKKYVEKGFISLLRD